MAFLQILSLFIFPGGTVVAGLKSDAKAQIKRALCNVDGYCPAAHEKKIKNGLTVMTPEVLGIVGDLQAIT